jgi:hypothetical protein
MSSKLILKKPELNPDVFFKDTTLWTIGADWTVFLNSAPGAIATNSSTDLELTDSTLRKATAYKYTLYVQSCSVAGTISLDIGGNTISISANASPQVYQGIVTTSSTSDIIKFVCAGGVTAKINYLKITESPDYSEIDLTEDIDVPITYSIADVKDPSKRNAAYSNTVTIPGTKSNNKYFTHIFEISGDGTFNPNKKVSAVVLNEGIELFNGVCQLKTINRIRNGVNNYNQITYEIVLLGKLIDAFYLLGDTLISDLDFSEYDHTYNITNQRDSWYTQIQKNGSSYVNATNGSALTIIGCQNSSGRVQINFSAPHGLVADDWILIPDQCLTAGSEFYYGEHAVYSVVSNTSVVLRCPFDVIAGTTLTSTASVKKHIKTGEGYVYPMCNYGAVTGNTWNVSNFYPAIYVKEYIDKIFKKIGFVYDSSFFTSTMFKKLIIPFNGGELRMTQAQIDAKKFRASSTALITSSYNISPSFDNSGYYYIGYKGHAISGFGAGPSFTPFSNTSPIILDVPINDDSTLPNFDNGGTFNTGTYRWVCPITANYDISLNASINHKYTLPAGVYHVVGTSNGAMLYNINSTSGQSAGMGYAQVEIYNYTTSTVVSAQYNIQLNQSGNIYISVNAFSFNAVAGQQYGVRLRIITPAKGQFYTVASNPQPTDYYTGNIAITYEMLAGAVFKNNITNTTLQDGDNLLMNICVPQKIKCTEFLTSIIKLFNLYVQPDSSNDKKLYIETRNDFYNAGTTLDWTDKLDTDENIQIIPMGELNAKTFGFAYAENKAPYGTDHKNKYGIGYGDFNYNVDNDFINGTNNTGVIFSASVLSEVQQGAGSGRIISETQGDSLRILYYNTSSTVNQIANNTWTHSGLSGSYSRRIFPYAGHLDKVEAPNYDLNWSYPRGVYFDYDSWTNRGLFNQHYKQMLQEITDKNSRIVTGYFHLTAYDIFSLDFRNTYIVDGHFLRLNKVSQFLVNKNIPVLCEFIKIEAKAPFVPTPYSSVLAVDPYYYPAGRMLNGEQNPELAMELNTSNAARLGTGVEINGQSNTVNSYGSKNVSINGDSNTVGGFVSNIVIQGDNNTVQAGLSNVSLINTSGVTVTESDTVYINGVKINSRGAYLNSNVNVIDAGKDVILYPFNEAKTINLVNGSEDAIIELGSFDITNNIDAMEDRII